MKHHVFAIIKDSGQQYAFRWPRGSGVRILAQALLMVNDTDLCFDMHDFADLSESMAKFEGDFHAEGMSQLSQEAE